jgi:hypothetical protein
VKTYMSKRNMFKNAQHISLLNFIIFGLLFVGYTLDFMIYKDWSFLYVTTLAPFLTGVVYMRKAKGERT